MPSRVLWIDGIAELEYKVGRAIRQGGLSVDLHVVDNAREAYDMPAPDKVTKIGLTEQKFNCLKTMNNCLLVFYSYPK